MASVADLVPDEALRRLADPARYDEGVLLADHGAVELDEFGPLRVTASVGGERVTLEAGRGELAWSCSCRVGVEGAFCEHAVAAAVATWRTAPPRRR